MQLNVLDDLAEAMKALDGKKQNTPAPDPFVSWDVEKSARRCGPKHIWK